MRRLALCFAILAAIGLDASASFAQRGGGPGGQKQEQAGSDWREAQVGAGVTDGTTTGISGKSGGGSGGPPDDPGPALCDAYQGVAHDYCLYTVLERSAPPEGD